MPTIYSAKIGSHPGTFVVLRGNVVPVVGKHVRFKEVPSLRCSLRSSEVVNKPWLSGVIDDISYCGTDIHRIFIGLM